MLPGFRFLTIVFFVLLLQGCLQVDLGGPVIGATVSVSELRTGQVILSGLRSKTTEQRRADYSAEQWNGFSARVRMLLSGTIDIPTHAIADDKYYLVTARGGLDLDSNGTGQAGAQSRAVAGQWHAIVTGAQLRGPLVRVNAITEAIYQSVKKDINELDNSELGKKLDTLAKRVLDDVNFDGRRNYLDALIWSNLSTRTPYRGQALFVRELIRSITEGHDSGIIATRGQNAVDYVNWHLARPGGTYKDHLIACASPVIIRDLCTFTRLPLLLMDSNPPSVDAIMQRLIVSHDWMAVRFEEMLHKMPANLLRLMGSLTTIAIGADIRPSYYSSVSASMYLDAGSFWVTAQEYETVSKEEDYRAAFGRKVAFTDLWRYVSGGQRAYSRKPDANGNRDPEAVRMAASSLLFHELAHANDYFPLSGTYPLSATPYSQLGVNKSLSKQLQEIFPLTSVELVSMGQVLYQGADPTAAQRTVGAKPIGDAFASDDASDLYAYSSAAEDFAMLFEESMMRIHFGFEREMAFTNAPTNPDEAVCADYVIGWGVRGRVGAPNVNRRAQWVVGQVLPAQRSKVAVFPAPVAMTAGQDWCAHLPPLPAPYLPGLMIDLAAREPVYERPYH